MKKVQKIEGNPSSNYEPFKYATEAGINMFLGPYWLCSEEDFPFMKDDPYISYYNLYFICQRSRIAVKPDSLKVSNRNLNFHFDVHEEDSCFQVPAAYPNPFKSKDIQLKSKYPHRYFFLEDKKNKDLLYISSSRILDDARIEGAILPDPKFLDFEVLYVGQTQRKSKTPAIDRLISHKTLQKIHTKKRPDKDIYIVLCCFDATGTVEVRGTVRTQEKYEKEDQKRLKSFMKSQLKLTPKQHITLTEAALIKYFEPEYNKIHKTFPKSKKKSYEFIYNMDLNAVSVEINTDLFFYTDKVKTSQKHFQRFYLSNDKERRKFLDFSVGFDTITKSKVKWEVKNKRKATS